MHSDTNLLKKGVWMYFLLLIFEGALRKWIPGLATPMLVARDPLVLWMCYRMWKNNTLPSGLYLAAIVVIGIIATITALLLGHGSFLVAIYGLRPLLIHFPMIFIIGTLFTKEDVIKLGRMVLIIAVPMTLLIALQFYSPQSAWINKGLNEEVEGAGLTGALGYFRPSGTFSFTNGTSLFYGLVACFTLYFWMNITKINKVILLAATGALLLAIPLSISRTLLVQVGLSLVFSILAVAFNPSYLKQIIRIIGAGAVVVVILMSTSVFQTATEVFTTRIDNASTSEGGVKGTFVTRIINDMTTPFEGIMEKPYFGYGIGMGTNAGSQLLTGRREFLIAEGEWGRVMGEMGLVNGLALLLLRLIFTIELSIASLKKLREGDLLPWMLLSFALPIMLQGGWSQATSLGFYTLIAGILLASVSKPVQIYYISYPEKNTNNLNENPTHYTIS
jgi:hypothetical protein